MSLYEYPSGEKSEFPLSPLDKNNIYEFIAENGPLAGPMLHAYVSGMQAMSSLIYSLRFQEKNSQLFDQKLKELIEQKSEFCDFVIDNILSSSLENASQVKARLQRNKCE